jgi:catechol 2,3-dioxygenase-like lactoylglutathione lyase family enzyme
MNINIPAFKGSGVHHVAIGVKDLSKMRSFYQNVLGFNSIFLEHKESEQESMRRVLRAPSVVFAATLFNQDAGGIMVELVHLENPEPRPVHKNIRFGDIGVSKITIAVPNVERIYEQLKGRVNFCSEPKSILIPEWGEYQFVYCRDPEGNFIELNSGSNIPVRDTFSGVSRVGISVTDLQRAKSFYQKYLGLDTQLINDHETFSGHIDEITGGNQTQIRSCVLANSNGGGMVELFKVIKPRGRSIPFSTNWGDFGYLQVCFYSNNINEMSSYYESEGLEFLSGLESMDDGIPEHAASFMYMKDPDGIPVELLSLVNT